MNTPASKLPASVRKVLNQRIQQRLGGYRAVQRLAKLARVAKPAKPGGGKGE